MLGIEFYEDLWVAPEANAETGLARKQDEYWYGPGKNVTAYIHSISIYGLMEIRFNASMMTDFNLTEHLTHLNKSLVDIYMIPDESVDSSNITNWNISAWEAVYFEDNVLRIQLNFTNTTAIS
jgi:hypothetical protein